LTNAHFDTRSSSLITYTTCPAPYSCLPIIRSAPKNLLPPALYSTLILPAFRKVSKSTHFSCGL
jgi:hypothetical protein